MSSIHANAFAFTPGGRFVALAIKNENHLFNMKTKKIVAGLGGHDGQITALAFAKNGALLASASRKEVEVWKRVGTGRKTTKNNDD